MYLLGESHTDMGVETGGLKFRECMENEEPKKLFTS